MSLPSTVSSPDLATSPPGEDIDLLHEQDLQTDRRGSDTPVETSAAPIVLDSDSDPDVTELSTPLSHNAPAEQAQIQTHPGEAAGRDASVRSLPHRSAPPAERRSQNQPGRAGATYDTAIDISSSPPALNRAERVPRSPASLSRRVSQRSSYIGDEYPAPQRGPPSAASIFDVDMAQTHWSGNSPGRSHTSGRRSSRDYPEAPGTYGGYRFPDMIPSHDGAVEGGSRDPISRRRPSSMFMPNPSRDLVDGFENMMYGLSPTSTRRFSGGSPRYYSDIAGPPRRQSSDFYDPSTRNRSFSDRYPGESSNLSRPGTHQRYSSMSTPRWQGPEGPSRNRRDRGSLPISGQTQRNTTLDDIFQDVSLPRWQPDSEVSGCPICGTIFSFWHRKHHCRKCGRVVCAACSPHRITIPRQYIVRPPESTTTPPPGSSPASSSNVVDLTGEDAPTSNSVLNPALGGGEEVRLCNPCVPDPNPNPLGYEALRQHGHRSTHSLSSTMGGGVWTPETRGSRQGRLTVGANDRPSTLGGLRQEVPRSSQAPPGERTPRTNSLYPIFNPPQQAQRPSAVSERDLCPICGNRFPPLDDEHPVEAREAHIRQCIDGYGASRESPVSQGPAEGPAEQAPIQSPPIARMLVFTATEKDCLGGDGAVAECTICMEDYEVGQVLARLECLCKFHKECIVDWFGRKAECPVHKVSY
ncbi:unnamed protein product [Penicillium pancosmium]